MSNPVEMFNYTLALKLGKTVREIRTEMSSSEYHSWIAYFKEVDQWQT